MCRVFGSLEVVAADDWVNHIAVVAPFLGDKLPHTFLLRTFLSMLLSTIKIIIFILSYHINNLAWRHNILTLSQIMTLTELTLLLKIILVMQMMLIILLVIISNGCNLILCSAAKIVR